jgi:hypothetical protein
MRIARRESAAAPPRKLELRVVVEPPNYQDPTRLSSTLQERVCEHRRRFVSASSWPSRQLEDARVERIARSGEYDLNIKVLYASCIAIRKTGIFVSEPFYR